MLNFPMDNLPAFFLGYAYYFELLAHVAVATNRYFVLARTSKDEVLDHRR